MDSERKVGESVESLGPTTIDSDDGDVAPARKRLFKNKTKLDDKRNKKLIVSAFLDTEAQVGDDDDEDENYEDDFILPDESTEAERLEHRQRLKRLQEDGRQEERRIGGTGHLVSAIDKLAKRYQDQTFEEGEDVELFDDGEVATYEETSALLPDFTDPKLWIIKLNRDSAAREVAISLQNKHLKLQMAGKSLGLYSCFAPPGVSGFIYVEADTKAQVIDALSGFRNVNLQTVKMVPLNEMASVFGLTAEGFKMPMVGDYVRVRLGRYAGDLGQVVEMDELVGIATVRVIPRIDPAVLLLREQLDDDVDGKSKYTAAGTAGGPPQRARKPRFEKRFFDRERIELKGGLIEQGVAPGTYRYQGMIFQESGHLLMRMSVKRLIVGDAVAVSLAELKEFNVDKMKGLLQDVATLRGSKRVLHLYKLGERVRVLRGELANVIGKVSSVDNDEIQITPDNPQIPPFKSHWSCILKHFVEGDNVRAIEGLNKGQVGLVAMVDGKRNSAVIFSPSTGQEFKCGLEYLTLVPSEGVGGGATRLVTLDGYSIGDLVQSATGQVGVVTSIERGGNFVLLGDDGSEHKVSTAQLVCKRSSFGQVARDYNQQNVDVGSKVTVVRGRFKQNAGVVQHIWKNVLFIKCENAQLHAVGADDCLSCAVSNAEGNHVGNEATAVAGTGTSANNKVESPTHQNRRRIHTKSPFLGKTVRIHIQGREKGSLGDIVGVEPRHFTISLKKKVKTIRVKREDVVVLDDWHGDLRRRSWASSAQGSDATSPDSSRMPFPSVATSAQQQPQQQLLPRWAQVGTVVRVIGVGEYQGKFGVITQLVQGIGDTNMQILHLLIDEDYIAIALESVEPALPRSVGDIVLAYQRPSNDQVATILKFEGSNVIQVGDCVDAATAASVMVTVHAKTSGTVFTDQLCNLALYNRVEAQ